MPTFEVSEDGVEKQLASNHIDLSLLINLLMGNLLKAGRGERIVNVSSAGFE